MVTTSSSQPSANVGARRPHASCQKNGCDAGKHAAENEQSAPPDARASVAVVQDVPATGTHVAMTAVHRRFGACWRSDVQAPSVITIVLNLFMRFV